MSLYELFVDRIRAIPYEGDELQIYYDVTLDRVKRDLESGSDEEGDDAPIADSRRSMVLPGGEEAPTSAAAADTVEGTSIEQRKLDATRRAARIHVESMEAKQALVFFVSLVTKACIISIRMYTEKKKYVIRCQQKKKEKWRRILNERNGIAPPTVPVPAAAAVAPPARENGEEAAAQTTANDVVFNPTEAEEEEASYQDKCKAAEDSAEELRSNLLNFFVRIYMMITLHSGYSNASLLGMVASMHQRKVALDETGPRPRFMLYETFGQRDRQFSQFFDGWVVLAKGSFGDFFRCTASREAAAAEEEEEGEDNNNNDDDDNGHEDENEDVEASDMDGGTEIAGSSDGWRTPMSANSSVVDFMRRDALGLGNEEEEEVVGGNKTHATATDYRDEFEDYEGGGRVVDSGEEDEGEGSHHSLSAIFDRIANQVEEERLKEKEVADHLLQVVAAFQLSETPHDTELVDILEEAALKDASFPLRIPPLPAEPAAATAHFKKLWLLQHTLYPSEVTPDRLTFNDGFQRITPFTSAEETNRILRWLGTYQSQLSDTDLGLASIDSNDEDEDMLDSTDDEGSEEENNEKEEEEQQTQTKSPEEEEENVEVSTHSDRNHGDNNNNDGNTKKDDDDEEEGGNSSGDDEKKKKKKRKKKEEEEEDIYLVPRDDGIITILRSQHILRLELSNPLPLSRDPGNGYQCDTCCAKDISVGFQAVTYKNVRKDVLFFQNCVGYDVCTSCIVYLYKAAVLRFVRAMHPDPRVRVSARHGVNARLVVWSVTCSNNIISNNNNKSDQPAEEGSGYYSVRVVVGVSPYGARPCAWVPSADALAQLSACWEPTVVGEGEDREAAEVPDPEAPIFPAYPTLTEERMRALPAPGPEWDTDGSCTVAVCNTDNGHGRTFADSDLCPVCLLQLASSTPTLRTTCGHWFHADCIAEVHSMHQRTDVLPQAEASSTGGNSESDDRDFCPVCRSKGYMPPSSIAYAVHHNVYELTVRVPVCEKGERQQSVAVATLLSEDGCFHNATNIAACQVLCVEPGRLRAYEEEEEVVEE